jgi:hypothetical protein
MRNYLLVYVWLILGASFFSVTLDAQTVSNVSVAMDGKNIEVSYDLEGDGVYNISLFYADSSGKNWIGPLKMVSGNVGQNQRAGLRKKIYWDAASEVSSIEGFFQFKVEAVETKPQLELANVNPTAQAEIIPEKPKKVLTDLERRKLTLVMEKAKKRRTPWLVGFLLMGGAGGFSYYQTGALYEKYKTATTDAASIRESINVFNYATPAALGLAGISFIEFLIKSGKYSSAKKALAGASFKFTPRGVGLTYTFR